MATASWHGGAGPKSSAEGGGFRGASAVCLLLPSIWAPAAGAAVLEKRVRHTILADGAVLEETALEVRLDAADDLDDWSPYYVHLDDHRTLEQVAASATRPDGSRVAVKDKRQDRVEIALPGILHGSAALQEIPFPLLPGSVLSIEHRVRVEPYFPCGRIVLAEDADGGRRPVVAAEVEVALTSSLQPVRCPDGADR